MFTFRPPGKNGNGHKSGNGNGNGNGNGYAAGNGHADGNGHGAERSGNGHSSPNALGWLGLGGKAAALRGNGNGNGHGSKIESVLGPGIHWKGDLSGVGGVRIEGTFDGSLSVKGAVVIADGAKVTADIQAGTVTVAGSLKGNVTAGKVEIRATGRIWGDLVTSAFATEEGAFLRGLVRMEDDVPLLAQPAAQLEAVESVEL